MPSLSVAADRERLLARLDRLTPASARRWGTMDAQRAICHLIDSMRVVLDEHAGPPPSGPAILRTTAARWLFIVSPLPWPKGRITVGEAFFATPAVPDAFERDRQMLRVLIERCGAAAPGARWGVHPFFGDLGPRWWPRMAARHVDWHLRQFGV